MKTRKGENISMGASNFVRSDYVELRLLKIEERLDRLEKIIESIIRPPLGPRTIQ